MKSVRVIVKNLSHSVFVIAVCCSWLNHNGRQYEKLPIAGDFLSVYTSFFTRHKRPKTAETRMYYTMCWRLALLSCLIFSISGCQGCIKPNVKLSIKKPVLLEISNQKVVCQVMQIVFFVVLKCKQLVKYLSY